MNIAVIDTETIDTIHPYCYNFAFLIYDTEEGRIISKHDFAVKEIYENRLLMSMAFYADRAIRNYEAVMSWRDIISIVSREFKCLNVSGIYAYNLNFDKKVCGFNQKVLGASSNSTLPFEHTKNYDIWGYASQFITTTNQYKKFCAKHNLVTENGNYKVNAESVIRFINNKIDFEEAHTALQDCIDELSILIHCCAFGEFNKKYNIVREVKTETLKQCQILINRKSIITFNYLTKIEKNNKIYFTFPDTSKVPPYFHQNSSNENF